VTGICTAAILAGGHGRRLGTTDKAVLRVGGQRIVDRQVAVLQAIADHVVIVAADATRRTSRRTPDLSAVCIPRWSMPPRPGFWPWRAICRFCAWSSCGI
jgi:CTP:molybdopterin cytidylyltransferase MocA